MRALSDPFLPLLESALAEPAAERAIHDALRNVLENLAASTAVMAWDVVPLAALGARLPPEIRSCWLFAIRGGAETTPERHPNSHQRSLCLAGEGTFLVHDGARWTSHPLSAAPNAALDERWVTIPPSTWHRLAVGPGPWGVVSFHTVAPADLIEQKPVDPDDLDGGTVQEPYVGRQ